MLYACVVSNSLNQNWFVPDSFETEIQQKLPDKNQIVTAFLRISKFISFQSMSFHFNKKTLFLVYIIWSFLHFPKSTDAAPHKIPNGPRSISPQDPPTSSRPMWSPPRLGLGLRKWNKGCEVSWQVLDRWKGPENVGFSWVFYGFLQVTAASLQVPEKTIICALMCTINMISNDC